MKTIAFTSIVAIILLISCGQPGKSVSKIEKKDTTNLRDTTRKLASEEPRGVKVSAYLIYADGSLSSFDVLNDKTVALWNVIAGGGDALQPSEKTKINLTTYVDSLKLKIVNGKKVVFNDTLILLNGEPNYTFVIKNTGCSEVYVTASKNKMVLYNDTIPFHCGE